ncbi:MAG TPA: tetraacyldisaccharide 4'-kinase [Methylophilus sp.]
MLQHWFEQQWQRSGWAQCLLRPLSWLFAVLSTARRWLYRQQWLASERLPVPVIVVGNISVGGVGKTPLVLWLVQQLRAAGRRPGIISRGYGGDRHGAVLAHSDPARLGDEPVLLAQRSGCPVWVDRQRVEAGRQLLASYPEIDVLICDDGLQHLALQRDLEICVVQRPLGLGNGQWLPAGPLREPLRRLQTVDIVVESGERPALPVSVPSYHMQLHSQQFCALHGGETRSPAAFQGQSLVAVAGIGHPQRFFDSLSALGLQFETRVFADHHAYRREDFAGLQGKTLLMTEKDAVKCRLLALTDVWYLPVDAVLTPLNVTEGLCELVLKRLETCKGNSI